MCNQDPQLFSLKKKQKRLLVSTAQKQLNTNIYKHSQKNRNFKQSNWK